MAHRLSAPEQKKANASRMSDHPEAKAFSLKKGKTATPYKARSFLISKTAAGFPG
jgi:hypothetical protein